MKSRLTSLVALALVAALPSAVSSASAPSASAATGTAPSVPGARPDPGFGPAARAAALTAARRQAPAVAQKLGLGEAQSLLARSVDRDVNGAEHVHYDRTVHGLPVIGGDMVVHETAGGGVTGVDYASDNPLAAVPTRASVPAARAVRSVSAREHLADGTVGSPALVVWAASGVPRPAWQVQVRGADAQGAPVKRVEYVDATSGAYIAGWSSLETATGTGRSLYAGTVPLTTSRANGKFVLKDPSRGGSTTVDVFNKSDGRRYLPGTIFKDGDNAWGNGQQSNRQTAAVDAAYGAAETWDYYKNTFGRIGIAGNGQGAKSRVHYAKNYDNAFWDDGCFCMTYGDGGRLFKPLVALDVAGHEMSHGVTSNTAGLLYFGEPGGLNEATSDIFGTMVEFSADNPKDPGDYWIGENVAKKATLGTPFLRRMDQPSLDTVQGMGSYDCWTPTMGADDPHFTSGVGNHFFYLLAEGTGPKTIGGRAHDGESCNSTDFTGIGRDTAAQIWYRALTTYMTSTSGYVDARDATIRAALDVAPSDCAAVEQTWDAVSVPAGLSSCAAGGPLDEGANVLGANPGFESGATGWRVGGTAEITKNLNKGIPHTGHWWAGFNAKGRANTALLTRTAQVTVPDTDTATLRFSLLVYSTENPALEHDTFDVTVNGTPIGAGGHWSNKYSNITYRRWSVPMSAFKGQTVTIGFRGVENSNRRFTGFLLDDVSLTER